MWAHLFLFILIYLTSLSTLQGQPANAHMSTKEIPNIMQQIFEQHISQKQMNAEIIKKSYMAYINQFDPYRIYLLESEVLPYQQLSDNAAYTALENYSNNNFTSFAALNSVIQKAVFRARAIRQEMEQHAAPLFYVVGTASDEFAEQKLPFAKTLPELQERMRSQFIKFINEEKIKFGSPVVMQNQSQILALFEKYMHEKENQYLYLNDQGKAVTTEMAENLFALHLLKAFTGSLDAHTSFYNVSEAHDLKMKLQKKFEGIGISVEERPDGKMQIAEITKGSPADQSQKIAKRDILLSVNGQDLKDLTLEEVMDILQNGTDKEVLLQLKRPAGEPFEVKLQRTSMTLDSERVKTAYQRLEGGVIGVITLNSFYQGENDVSSASDIQNAIRRLQAKGPIKGIILDLRDNSGGFLMQAVKTAGLFMTNGVVVISKYFNGDEHFYRDLDGRKFYDGPLIILTSRATASAAEIVAQALQDYGIAVIVGDKETYGKGTIQNQTVTKENATSLFKVTVGKYYTVSGKTPQLNGVKVDIVVPGPFNYEQIGEKFLLSTIPADTIPADYNDALDDLTFLQKQWFVHHYLPTLQQKQIKWSPLLKELRMRSAQRISQNIGYQRFLRNLQTLKPGEPIRMDQDYQLMEAVNVLKDMISLTSLGSGSGAISENSRGLSK